MNDEMPKSQLPQDQAYWDELAQRIHTDASGPLATYARAHEGWYVVLARRAPWLTAASVAAMLVLWLALPNLDSSVAFRWMERSLAPDEPAGTLLGGPEPPSVERLMAQFPPAAEDERRP
jgi:hypothetical protein